MIKLPLATQTWANFQQKMSSDKNFEMTLSLSRINYEAKYGISKFETFQTLYPLRFFVEKQIPFFRSRRAQCSYWVVLLHKEGNGLFSNSACIW